MVDRRRNSLRYVDSLVQEVTGPEKSSVPDGTVERSLASEVTNQTVEASGGRAERKVHYKEYQTEYLLRRERGGG